MSGAGSSPLLLPLPHFLPQIQKSKLGTGRVVVARELRVPLGYTLEASLSGGVQNHFGQLELERMGADLIRAFGDTMRAEEEGALPDLLAAVAAERARLAAEKRDGKAAGGDDDDGGDDGDETGASEASSSATTALSRSGSVDTLNASLNASVGRRSDTIAAAVAAAAAAAASGGGASSAPASGGMRPAPSPLRSASLSAGGGDARRAHSDAEASGPPPRPRAAAGSSVPGLRTGSR